MSNTVMLIPMFFPFLASTLLGMIKFATKEKRNIFVASIIIANFLFLLLIIYLKGTIDVHLFMVNNFLDLYFKIDKLGILFAMLASTLWIFTAFYSFSYMTHEGKEKRFFVFFTFTLGITISIAFAGNLFTFYVFYELLTLSTFPLVIHSGTREALESGKKYLIYSFGGATLVLLGMILLFSISQDMTFIPNGVFRNIFIDNSKLLLSIYMILFIGFGVKAALVPFHSWLPSAMVAPTPVSALLHAVAVVKAGVFAIIRVSYYIFGSKTLENINGNLYISFLIIFTILLGSLLALHQENLKKRLAYSTVSQLGYILLGVVLLNENALIGGILHLVNHAFIKILLFFCAGAIYFTTGKKTIGEIKGIGKKMPITMWCFAIATFSLIGIPPANGFVSKWYLAAGGLNSNNVLFVIILLVSAFLTAAYLLPIVIAAFFQGDKDINNTENEPPLSMLLPIILLTAIVVLLGLFPNHVLNYIESIAKTIV
ncbi:proton-conducting transporter membrane subunit [Sporosalibacterium faouarense]|uniref:proton-conducting transporter transmembrane domain-containing protein n=1 Tax=Sporosalibacterium faouarense TaxID=516123 RepID=UPI00141C4858|nr:proton-conducting transporter membrane subunit [Sporosalibacterium faouarense]MTI46916.1 monovalent cation/H+ antiporter subunit D family protein [Bacillota bacterium]